MSEPIRLDRALPVGSNAALSSGWWGMCALIVTEAALFGYLLFSYLYLAAQTQQRWPPGGLPKLGMAGLNTLILLTSSGLVWASENSMGQGRMQRSRWLMLSAIIFGSSFVAIQLQEWRGKPFTLTSDLYGSLYFTITGFHLFHVIIGLIILALLLLWNLLGYFKPHRHTVAKIGGMYWHFVDVVWLFVFSILYLLPYCN